MSQMLLHDPSGVPDPERILRRLPEAERERFLSEYRTALDAAHEVWRYRQLQELLARWELVAIAVSKPGYAQALEEARTGAGDSAAPSSPLSASARYTLTRTRAPYESST